MKKLISILLLITLLAVGCSLLITPAQAASDSVTLTSSGSLADALNTVADGGTIVIEGTYVIPSGFQWTAHNKTVTITGGVLDFTNFGQDGHLTINDNVTFTAIAFKFATIDWNAENNESADAKSAGAFKRTNIYANGHSLTIAADVTFTEGATNNTNVCLFGGSKGGTVNGDTNLTVLAGWYTYIFGGGHGGTVNGSTYVTVGGNVNSTAVISNHDSNYNVYGGGWADNITGSTYLTIQNNARLIYAYGGSHGSNSKVGGTTNLRFTGGTLMSIYGGHNSGANTGTAANVVMTGGTVDQIFGASNGANFGTATKPVGANVTVLGGKVTRRVYGGCYNNFANYGLSDFGNILAGKLGTWSSTYQVFGKITVIISDTANLALNTDNDRALYARSRLSIHNNTGAIPTADEKSTLIFLGTYQGNKLMALDGTMQKIMSTVTTAADEIHTLTYSASGAVITQTCNGSGHDKDASSSTAAGTAHSVTATLATTSNAVYTGSAIKNVQITYDAGWMGDPLSDISYTNNINAGTATASASVNGATATLNFTIAKAAQAAPTVTAVAESIKGKADGRINGLSTAMEISTDGSTFAPVTDTSKTYAAGTYYVRLAATDNYNASPATTVTVAAGRQLAITFVADGATVATKYVSWNATLTDIPAVPAKAGYTQTPPTWNVTDFAGITTDMTVTAVYTVNVYTVTFVADGNTVDTKTVTHGSPLSDIPVVPAKEGYNAAWDTANFDTVTGDMTVNAVYTVKTYTVTFVIDGTTAKTETVEHGKSATAPEIPHKAGFDRVAPAWSTAFDSVTADLTVNAVYTPNLYTVTFMVDGEVYATETIGHGTALNALPPVPEKVGYSGAWESGDLSEVTDDMTVTAVYTVKSYTVVFVADGKEIGTVAVIHGNGVINVPAIPPKTGYTQTAPYWDTDLTAVTSDLRVTAVYTVNLYTVTFVADGKTVATKTVEHGAALTDIPAVPAKEGHDAKWSKASFPSVTADTTVTAQYTAKTYTVTFRYDGRSTTKTVRYGTKLSEISGRPTIPAKEGYDKVAPHWDHTDDTVVTGPLIVNAVYTVNEYTVTFVADGNTVDTVTVEHGKGVTAPAIPEKVGYTAAWNTENFDTVKGDMTVTAVYTVKTYTVTFVADGKTVDTVTVEHGSGVTAPAIPEKVGYTQTAPTWDAAFDSVTADLTVNAVYTVNVYTVTFVTDINIVDTKTVTHGEALTDVPTVPTKEGYTAAWDTADFDTVTGDMTVTAVYTQIPTEPDTPDEPDAPTEPDTPDEPDAPNTPDTPDAPESGSTDTPNAGNGADNGTASEENGGSSAVVIVIAIVGGCVVIGIAVAVVAVKKKKRTK